MRLDETDSCLEAEPDWNLITGLSDIELAALQHR